MDVEHGAAAFFGQAAGVGRIEFEEIENDPAQGTQVFGGMPDVGLVVLLAECGVQDPVAAVFDAPMLTDVALERTSRVEAADVVADFPADFVAVKLARVGFHVNQAAQISQFPQDFDIHLVETMVVRDTPRNDAAVGFFDPLVMDPPK